MTIHVNKFTAVEIHLSDRQLDDLLLLDDSLIDYDDDIELLMPMEAQPGGLIAKQIPVDLDDEVIF